MGGGEGLDWSSTQSQAGKGDFFQAGPFSLSVHGPVEGQDLVGDRGIGFVWNVAKNFCQGLRSSLGAVFDDLGFMTLPFPLLDTHRCVVFTIGPFPVADAVSKDAKRDSSDVLKGFFCEEAVFAPGGDEYKTAFVSQILDIGLPCFFMTSNGTSRPSNVVVFNQLLIDM